jgi:hypothetical protein
MPNFNFEKTQSHVGNPLKMIKEYKSATGGISNASTKGFEEMNRYNQIMQEPIENLMANMNYLSRPMSSHNMIQANNTFKNKRAMTAHNKIQMNYRKNTVGGNLKIA